MTSNQTPAGLRDMKDAPKGVPIVVRMAPSDRMPDGWVATVRLQDKPDWEDDHWTDGDALLHYNGDVLVAGFKGVYEGWLPLTTGFAPVVTEEAVDAGGLAIGDMAVCNEPFTAARAALTAALPHAKTEAQVENALLERLIAEAESQCAETSVGYRGKRRDGESEFQKQVRVRNAQHAAEWLRYLKWLRAQKGKSDE